MVLRSFTDFKADRRAGKRPRREPSSKKKGAEGVIESPHHLNIMLSEPSQRTSLKPKPERARKAVLRTGRVKKSYLPEVTYLLLSRIIE